MRFSIKKLKDAGFNFLLDEDQDMFELYPATNHNSKPNDLIREAAAIMGFNEMETDCLTCEAYRIRILSALRKASEL